MKKTKKIKKTYRVFQDFVAKDKIEAGEMFLDALNILEPLDIQDIVRIQEDPFTDEEEEIIFEAARIALADDITRDVIAEILALDETQYEKLKTLRDRIGRITPRVRLAR